MFFIIFRQSRKDSRGDVITYLPKKWQKRRMSKHTSKDCWPCNGPAGYLPLSCQVWSTLTGGPAQQEVQVPYSSDIPSPKSLSVSFNDLISKILLQHRSFFSRDHSLWVTQSKDPHSSGRPCTGQQEKQREKWPIYHTHFKPTKLESGLFFTGQSWNYKDRRMLKFHIHLWQLIPSKTCKIREDEEGSRVEHFDF